MLNRINNLIIVHQHLQFHPNTNLNQIILYVIFKNSFNLIDLVTSPLKDN